MRSWIQHLHKYFILNSDSKKKHFNALTASPPFIFLRIKWQYYLCKWFHDRQITKKNQAEFLRKEWGSVLDNAIHATQVIPFKSRTFKHGNTVKMQVWLFASNHSLYTSLTSGIKINTLNSTNGGPAPNLVIVCWAILKRTWSDSFLSLSKNYIFSSFAHPRVNANLYDLLR